MTPKPYKTRTPVPTWHVIGRGLAGWHANGVNVSSSGGDLEPRAWWAGGMTTGYLQEAPNPHTELVSSETAYGRTVGYPFALKVF